MKRGIALPVALLLLSACATLTPPPSEPLSRREALLPVGLVVRDEAPALALDPATAGKGEGAVKGFGLGVVAGIAACGLVYGLAPSPDRWVVLLLCPIAIIGGVAASTVSGAVQARPEQEILHAREIIMRAARDPSPALTLRNALDRVGARQPERSVRVFPADNAPASPTAISVPQDLDSVVVLEIAEIALVWRAQEANPPMAIRVTVLARRHPAPDGTPVSQGTYRATSGAPRTYSAWAADGGAAMRIETAHALADIAAQILDSLPPTKPARTP